MIKKYLKNKKGFTMLELIVVIVIMGVLAVVFYPQVRGREDSAKVQSTEVQILRLWESSRIWRLNTGNTNYANLTNIDVLVTAGIILDKDKTNSFGNQFTLSGSGNNVTVTTNIGGSNPNTNCGYIASKIQNKGFTASCSGSTLTATFNE